ncbi:hypothetical protein [Mucilaginibacter sp.]|uniref:hypothetical protein n=1 Tax=Mucilaginibacter sp. TaxID=1882438 RepID=UPI002CC2AADD|nr:hypothetical protein [Mucilaginibacter sp.]HTI59149.1 hypothetical protein [Mucilaginibacter sp.]
MEETELQNELASIRSIMERSSKFISLSGLSGILAGIYALIGAGIAYMVINNDPNYILMKKMGDETARTHNIGLLYYNQADYLPLIVKLLLIAVAVLLTSILTAVALSNRQAKRKGQQMWGSVSRSLIYHMAVPLLSGGILILILLLHHHYGIVSAASLIFYGLALFSAGTFTFADVKYLGLCEIILGLIAACLPGHGLLFWALGFGVLHIVYGARIYLKYDR